GPGEVRLHGQASPVSHFDADEGRVVVPVADAGIDAHTASELSVGAVRRAENRSVQHAAREIKSARPSGSGPSSIGVTCDTTTVQITPQAPYARVRQIAGAGSALIGD